MLLKIKVKQMLLRNIKDVKVKVSFKLKLIIAVEMLPSLPLSLYFLDTTTSSKCAKRSLISRKNIFWRYITFQVSKQRVCAWNMYFRINARSGFWNAFGKQVVYSNIHVQGIHFMHLRIYILFSNQGKCTSLIL